jgi:hypothetical protein
MLTCVLVYCMRGHMYVHMCGRTYVYVCVCLQHCVVDHVLDLSKSSRLRIPAERIRM